MYEKSCICYAHMHVFTILKAEALLTTTEVQDHDKSTRICKVAVDQLPLVLCNKLWCRSHVLRACSRIRLKCRCQFGSRENTHDGRHLSATAPISSTGLMWSRVSSTFGSWAIKAGQLAVAMHAGRMQQCVSHSWACKPATKGPDAALVRTYTWKS